MRYSCKLSFKCDPEVFKLFAPSRSGRATLSVEMDKGGLVLHVQAEDAVALRAQLNSLAKLLAVWEAASEAGKWNYHRTPKKR